MYRRDRNPSPLPGQCSTSPTPDVPLWVVKQIEDRVRKECQGELKKAQDAHESEMAKAIQRFRVKEDALKKSLAGERGKMEHQDLSNKAIVRDLKEKLTQSQIEVYQYLDITCFNNILFKYFHNLTFIRSRNVRSGWLNFANEANRS